MHRTPLRAIPSLLASKSTPSIPPASQKFEPLAKSILSKRLTRNILPYAALVCWTQSSAWTIWSLGVFDLGFVDMLVIPFSLRVLTMAVVMWVIGVLPVVISPTRAIGSSPATTMLAALKKPHIRNAVLVYMASAVLMTCLYVSMAYATESGNPGLSFIITKSTRRRKYRYINRRLVFLTFSQLTAACGYFLRNILLDRYAFVWSSTKRRTSQKNLIGLFDLTSNAMVVTFMTGILLSVATCGALLAISARAVLSANLFPKSFDLSGAWNTVSMGFRLMVRAWTLMFTTLSIWEASEFLFETYVSQPITVTHMSTDPPELTLISGISSSDRILKYHAYSDLHQLASDPSSAASARRTALFTDQKHMPSMWRQLVRESLFLLGEDYQLLLRRGQPAPKPVPPPVVVPPPPTGLPSTPIALEKRTIFKDSASKRSPLRKVIDSLASDGSLTQVVDEGAEKVGVPELLQTVQDTLSPDQSVGNRLIARGKSAMDDIISTVSTRMPSLGLVSNVTRSCKTWCCTPRISREAEVSLPMRELDLVVIQVLSHLTSASLTEDSFGVVQKDIPKILEAMISFMNAIEAYQQEILAKYTPPAEREMHVLAQNEALREEVEKATAVLAVLGDGLRESIARIVQTFGESLSAFKFPPRIAVKLQTIVDYL